MRWLAHDAGRQRLNINSAVDCNDLSTIVRYDDTINAQSTIKLFQQIELQNPGAARIHIICDNARYYHVNVRQLLCRTRPAPRLATLAIDRSLPNHRSRLSAKI